MISQPCIVCKSLNAPLLFRTRDRHYGIQGEFNLVQCSGCGLVHLDPIPTEQELSSFYANDYYSYQPQKRAGWFKRLARKILYLKIKTHNPKSQHPGEFLDIGCGSGDYLHVMLAKGWRVRGVEPSEFGSAEGRRAGFDIFNGTLLKANFPPNSFDYVRLNHSFEHIPNPVEVLDEIYRILKPQGKLYIGIPNIDSLPYRIFGRYWWYLGAPLHTHNYTVTIISTLMRRSGLTVDRVYYNSNYGSLLGSLQIYANRNSSRKSTEGWLIRNPFLIVLSNIAMWAIDLMGQGDAIEVIAQKPL